MTVTAASHHCALRYETTQTVWPRVAGKGIVGPMSIRAALGWLGLFLFAATAEARGLATLARPTPLSSTLATLDAHLTHDVPRLGDEAAAGRR